MNRVLVVAAHPDDEILGCGGTMAYLAKMGWDVGVYILGEGITSREMGERCDLSRERVNNLRREAEEANRRLGVNNVFFEAYPDNMLDTVPRLKLVQDVEKLVASFNASVVFTHQPSDLNIDHQCVFHSVITACRPIPGHVVKRIYSFEVLSSTEWQAPSGHIGFRPNVFVDISNYLDEKIAAFSCYSGELKSWPHPRSVEGVCNLAKRRGSTVGVNAAEAFVLQRAFHENCDSL